MYVFKVEQDLIFEVKHQLDVYGEAECQEQVIIEDEGILNRKASK